MRGLGWAAALLLAAGATSANAYDRLYVFGDSLVDSGNAATQVPGSAPPSGRFTNGYNFADDLSVKLGLGLATAYLQGGTNYAVGGATVAPWAGQTSPDLGSQITGYYEPSLLATNPLGARPAIDANSLVLVTAGGNDVRDYGKYGVPTPSQTVASLQADLGRLVADGARNIVVVGLPDIGLIPSVVGTASAAGATYLSQTLNGYYSQIVTGIQTQLGASGSIRLFDLYSLQHEVTADPAAFGLDPALIRTDCVDNGGLATNCAGYAYYDGIHPTAQLHSLIAAQIAAQLPEPASWALLILGFGAVGVALRRREAVSARRA